MTSRATSERTVLGRYVLGPTIGRGATAVVRRARDLVTGDDVAVKSVPADPDLAPRVRAEVRAAQRLDHPGVVALLDWGEDDESLHLVWELVEGPSLLELLREPRGLDATEVVRIGAEVLSALGHAHRAGVVHRDVKPANILIGSRGRALLSDFGVARLSGEAGLTLTGSVVGTVAYMAPEQARGETAGPASDVYSACLVVYEGLTGSNPVSAPSPAVTARRAASGAVPPLSRARPDLPPRLCRAVDAGLRHDPAARPGAVALADELEGVLSGSLSARARARRMLPPLASAVGGAALAAVALWTAGGQLAESGAQWQEPGPRAVAIGLTALAFAWRPRAALLASIVAGSALVGLVSPGAAIVLGAIALVTLAIGWHTGRLTLLPAACPLLFALGLGPLYAAVAGLVPRWRDRLWVATAGVVATLVWQVAAGADGLMAGGGHLAPGVETLDGQSSPLVAARRLWDPLAAHPEALLQALAMVVGAMCVPLVLRARPGRPRAVAATVWVVLVAGSMVAVATAGVTALGAVVPAGLVVVAWALRPWRVLRRRAPARASATLRSPTA